MKMMMLPKLLALSLAVAPNLVNAAIFPQDSLVKMLDHKGFKQAMKENVRLQSINHAYPTLTKKLA